MPLSIFFLWLLLRCSFFLNHHLRKCLLILERGRGERNERARERETLTGERKTSVFLLIHTLTADHTCNLGMGPVQESNPQLLVYRTMLQPSKPHWPGQDVLFITSFQQLNDNGSRCAFLHVSPDACSLSIFDL